MKLSRSKKSSFTSLLPLLWLAVVLATTTVVQARNGQHHGNHGGRLGGLFGLERPDFVNKTCSASFECPLRRHHRTRDDNDDTTNKNGTFVCRTTYRPMTGENRTRAICIPTDRGLDSDECGCCGDDCPTIPEFEEITCTGQEELLDTFRMSRRGGRFNQDGNVRRSLFQGGRGSMGGHGGGGMGGMGGRAGGGMGGHGGGGGRGGRGTPAIVCRELYNPFTGDQERVTIPIDSSKSLDGDNCGCCDGICPDEISRRPFERPEEVQLDWCTAEELTTCSLPKRGQQDGDEEQQEGVFVCRSRANPMTGVEETRPVCISPDAAWDTDQCGCCGSACPERPTRTDVDCDADVAVSCDRRNGKTGVFVCRSFFHPLEGTPAETTLCIPEDKKTWTEDDCGCCEESGCPVTPSEGFDDEETQIMSFAMSAAGAEEVSFANEEQGAAPTSGVSRFSVGVMATSIVSMVGAILW